MRYRDYTVASAQMHSARADRLSTLRAMSEEVRWAWLKRADATLQKCEWADKIRTDIKFVLSLFREDVIDRDEYEMRTKALYDQLTSLWS